MTKKKFEKGVDYPEWYNDISLKVLTTDYTLENESPNQLYRRIAKSVSQYGECEHLEEKFYEYMIKGWLCPASPVLSNSGTGRGMPISCFGIEPMDDTYSIFDKVQELAMLSKYGGGVGFNLSPIRKRGDSISRGGTSNGVVPWAKIYDSTTVAISQGAVRRGASSANLNAEHGDFEEFLKIRRPEGSPDHQCLNIHHCLQVSDSFMQKVESGDAEAREKWFKILKTRVETGEPYLMFIDNVNRANPECYKKNNLKVSQTNICCLGGDTSVLTKNGPETIQNLVGKTVEIWDGNQWIKNSSFEMKGYDYLYRIYIKDGSYIDCNDKHRWFVSETYNDIRNSKVFEKNTLNLKEGDFIEYHSVEFHGDVQEKSAYLKGFLIGDGTSVNDRPLLRIFDTKYECINMLIESGNEIVPSSNNTNTILDISCSKEYDYSGQYNTFGSQKSINLKGLSARKKELFAWSKEYKKYLPDFVYSWNKKSKLLFLAGLFDADGTCCNQIQLSSKNKQFIFDLQKLLKTLGYSSFIDQQIKDETIMYRISVSSFDSYQFLKIAPCKRIKYLTKAPNRKTTGWRKIIKIEKLNDKKYPVYCPTVPTTGKFALANGLMTGNSEIALYTDHLHSFVCCLSSLNLARWEEWKDSDLIETAIYFLDGVMEEFIQKASKIKGFENAVRFAQKSRALGLGVLGWHTLLQDKAISFDSFAAMQLNAKIFKTINERTLKASKELAEIKGEPEWCKGHGVRNTHRTAIAPTATNSVVSGCVSPGIETIAANIFSLKTAKGTFVVKNPILARELEKLNMNNEKIWKKILEDEGSVQNLDIPDEMKEVFLTAVEINQNAVIRQAAQRQKYIDQSQSLNLFFPANIDASFFNKLHIDAWKAGIKTLYYVRTKSVLRGDLASRAMSDDCKACEG